MNQKDAARINDALGVLKSEVLNLDARIERLDAPKKKMHGGVEHDENETRIEDFEQSLKNLRGMPRAKVLSALLLETVSGMDSAVFYTPDAIEFLSQSEHSVIVNAKTLADASGIQSLPPEAPADDKDFTDPAGVRTQQSSAAKSVLLKGFDLIAARARGEQPDAPAQGGLRWTRKNSRSFA